MRLRRLSPWAPVYALIALVCCAGADAAGPAIVVAGEPPGAPKDAAVAPAQEIQLQGAQGGRALLCAREYVSRAATDRVVPEGARRLQREVEDLFLAPSVVLVGADARIGDAAARDARAAPHQEQRLARPERTRSRLRADQAAERDRLFHGWFGRSSSCTRSSQGLGADR